jgi:hypothetical protein
LTRADVDEDGTVVFENIFSTAQQTAQSGSTTEKDLSSYIPIKSTCVPPHDPTQAQGQQDTPQPIDPKMVRETAPEAYGVLGWITGLTATTQQAAGRENTVASNPASTVDAAAPVMEKGNETTRKSAENFSPKDRQEESDSQS